ncbi:MAG: hypothetical protein KDA89_24055 [Planctomycetaceae bacterium]|nr:hypothetical protein [Planctomycetaceae bacterium]
MVMSRILRTLLNLKGVSLRSLNRRQSAEGARFRSRSSSTRGWYAAYS